VSGKRINHQQAQLYMNSREHGLTQETAAAKGGMCVRSGRRIEKGTHWPGRGRPHEWQHPFGVVQKQGLKIIGFQEKPIARSYINAGVYALNPEALACLSPDQLCDMPTLFEKLRSQGNLAIAYPMHEPWLDVGRPDDLNLASERMAKGKKV
jgi:hypothetical protein